MNAIQILVTLFGLAILGAASYVAYLFGGLFLGVVFFVVGIGSAYGTAYFVGGSGGDGGDTTRSQYESKGARGGREE